MAFFSHLPSTKKSHTRTLSFHQLPHLGRLIHALPPHYDLQEGLKQHRSVLLAGRLSEVRARPQSARLPPGLQCVKAGHNVFDRSKVRPRLGRRVLPPAPDMGVDEDGDVEGEGFRGDTGRRVVDVGDEDGARGFNGLFMDRKREREGGVHRVRCECVEARGRGSGAEHKGGEKKS